MKTFILLILAISLFLPFAYPQPEIDRLVKEWDRQDQEALDNAVRQIYCYFDSLKEGVSDFTEEIYSLEGKFWTLCDSEYPAQAWQRHLFSEEAVRTELQRIVKNFVWEIESNRNRALLKIQASLENIGRVYPRIPHFERILQKHIAATSRGTAHNAVLSEVVSIVVGEILTVVMIDIVAETGFMATGTAVSGAVTFGVGLLVGVLISVAVDHFAMQQAQQAINDEIDHMRDKVLNELGETLLDALDEYKKRKHEVLEECAF